jgi:hypothetical protein
MFHCEETQNFGTKEQLHQQSRYKAISHFDDETRCPQHGKGVVFSTLEIYF